MFFFFNDTATTEIYTLSLHDALPISFANAAIRLPIRNSCEPLRRNTPSVCPAAHGRNHDFDARPSPPPKHPRPVVSSPKPSRPSSYPRRLAPQRAAANPLPIHHVKKQSNQCNREFAASFLAIPHRAVAFPNRSV